MTNGYRLLFSLQHLFKDFVLAFYKILQEIIIQNLFQKGILRISSIEAMISF